MPSRSSHQRCSLRKVSRGNFAKFAGKYLCQGLFFNKVAGLKPATLLKKRFWHRCFPVNFVKFRRTPFYKEHLRWLYPQSYCKEPQYDFVEEITLFPLVILKSFMMKRVSMLSQKACHVLQSSLLQISKRFMSVSRLIIFV